MPHDLGGRDAGNGFDGEGHAGQEALRSANGDPGDREAASIHVPEKASIPVYVAPRKVRQECRRHSRPARGGCLSRCSSTCLDVLQHILATNCKLMGDATVMLDRVHVACAKSTLNLSQVLLVCTGEY